jgi:hypothetical protein
MKKHGGKRKGAGRKKGEPTIPISFRVKVRIAEEIKESTKKEIERLNELHSI